MKLNKIFIAFALLLVCVLGYGVYSSNKGEDTNKTKNKEVKVGVLQLLSHPALDQIYKGLEDGLAKEGIEVYIISSQLNLPVLDNGTMATIVKEERLDKVFVGGHSLGGVVSTIEAKKLNEIDKVAGLILLASYPDQSTDISETQIPVLSITASNDKILKQEKYEDAKSRLPESTLYTTIKGGNHSGFGLYGQQNGDGTATMSAEEQQQELVQLIKQFIISH